MLKERCKNIWVRIVGKRRGKMKMVWAC